MYNYDSDIISPEELCEWLMIGRTTASRLLNSGDIKCFKSTGYGKSRAVALLITSRKSPE